MGEKSDHTLVKPNQMHHHCINIQDNPCMHKPVGITLPQEDINISLYMAGTIVCDGTSSPTQQQLEDCSRIIFTSQHDWDPHSVRFPKGLHRYKEKYLFANLLWRIAEQAHETDIFPGLRNTVQNSSFIVTGLVSQVRITDTNVYQFSKDQLYWWGRIEGWRQDMPSHRTFTSKERYSDFNPHNVR